MVSPGLVLDLIRSAIQEGRLSTEAREDWERRRGTEGAGRRVFMAFLSGVLKDFTGFNGDKWGLNCFHVINGD
jgi:hypothetical protein